MSNNFNCAILIAVWLYKDAERRGEREVLWLIILPIIGINWSYN